MLQITQINNLENITPGLTDAFHRTYGFHVKSQKSSFYIPNYVVLSDGKYYPYPSGTDGEQKTLELSEFKARGTGAYLGCIVL